MHFVHHIKSPGSRLLTFGGLFLVSVLLLHSSFTISLRSFHSYSMNRAIGHANNIDTLL